MRTQGDTFVGGHWVFSPTIILKPERVRLGDGVRIDSFCKLEGGQGLELGKNVHVGSFSHLNIGGGFLLFEDHSGCSSHCSIASASPDWEYLSISAADPKDRGMVRYFRTIVKEYALLCVGVTIVPGVVIGKGAVVKPGSVVYDDVPDWAIVQGNPARMVGIRSVKYEVDNSILLR